MSAVPSPELDAEQEVDFARYLRALLSRWWLLLAGVIAGAIIGYVATLSGGGSWKATTEVYLGQPLAPGGAAPVTNVPTTLGLVTEFVTTESVLREVAAKVGLPVGKLRGHVTTKPVLGVTGAKVGTPAPLLDLTVDGTPPKKVTEAADELANLVISRIGPYSKSKIDTLTQNLAYDQSAVKATNERLGQARANQTQILNDKAISATDKLVALANLNSVITQALQQQNALSQDVFQVQQQLSLAQNVEAAHVVSAASATRTSGPSRRTGIVVGAVIGLILGILAALLWEPLSRSWSKPSASRS